MNDVYAAHCTHTEDKRARTHNHTRCDRVLKSYDFFNETNKFVLFYFFFSSAGDLDENLYG